MERKQREQGVTSFNVFDRSKAVHNSCPLKTGDILCGRLDEIMNVVWCIGMATLNSNRASPPTVFAHVKCAHSKSNTDAVRIVSVIYYIGILLDIGILRVETDAKFSTGAQ